MTIEAKVIAYSVSSAGKELVTLQLQYPRIIHGELMTHRVLSRNAMSSRAVPVQKMLEQVRDNPFVPMHWGQNQPGMQAREQVSLERREEADYQWRRAAGHAAYFAEQLHGLGLHKQIVNRLLEPFQWMRTIVTATEWDNFFALRCHPDAEPHFEILAHAMRTAILESDATPRGTDPNDVASWHLPYITDDERRAVGPMPHGPHMLAMCSTARCARVSYLTHEGKAPEPEADLELYQRLAGSNPIHASPLEHIALACDHPEIDFGNFKGWVQFRKMVETQTRPNREIAHA